MNTRQLVGAAGGATLLISLGLLLWSRTLPDASPTPAAAITPTSLPATSIPQLGPPKDGTWKLAFSDEFDGKTLDRARWTVCYWWDVDGCTNLGNKELEWYLPENVTVSDGALHLRAEKKSVTGSDGATYPYTSGMVTTGPVNYTQGSTSARFTFHNGFAEIKARVPKGSGLWPAFWMLPVDMTSKPEIDVLEIIGDQTDVNEMHLHYLDERGEEVSPGESWQGPDFSQDWHVFAVDWRSDRVVWYVDGIERWRFDDVPYVPSRRMYLLLNLAVGGTWPGPPGPDTAFPATFDIDYVRVWQAAQ